MFLIFDTETTGLPKNYNAPVSDSENWPRMVQIAWQLHDLEGKLVEAKNYIIKPEGYTIPYNSTKIHGISTEKAESEGIPLLEVLEIFQTALDKTSIVAGHNIEFDINIAGAEYYRKSAETNLLDIASVDTKDESTEYCAIPGGRGGGFKWPTLTELHNKLFGQAFDEAHNAAADVVATTRCFLELIRLGIVPESSMGLEPGSLQAFKENHKTPIEPIELDIETQSGATAPELAVTDIDDKEVSTDAPFVHLHNHTRYSVLQSTTDIPALVQKAKDDGMPAVAITDHGNMFGSFLFVRECLFNDIKPIIGCEFYFTKDRSIHKFTKDNPDRRFNQVLLAKNKAGYQNLIKLCSIGYTEGYYAGYPRIDKEALEQYTDNLIAISSGTRGEIGDLILNVGETQAEEAFKYWHELFGDDFYVELVRHGLEEEEHLNKVLISFCEKYGVKYIAANNAYYLNQEDANAHDILLCVKDGEQQSTPIGRGRGFRFGMPNNEYFFKSQANMRKEFADLPEAIENIQEIVDKIEAYELKRDILLPAYDLPEGFDTQDDYLKHLTYEGAKERYPELNDEVKDRLDLELRIIKDMGFPGYFLIVQDFTSKAREIGVSVGPGRGSAAGSAVAYCVGITNIDPIKYKLLFERFLNPERVSMPDIDIDFDDEGRQDIINYVVDKHGKDQVAQIITYGSMAAKSAIRDVARVMDFPLRDTDKIAKLVPDFQSLKKILHADLKELSSKLNSDQLVQVKELKQIQEKGGDASKIIDQAEILEGSLRNTGIHACGVIITPEPLDSLIPVAVAKDADLLVTQFDNKVVEDAGMLKMDFLGLKTLTIIKHAIQLVKERHGVIIDSDEIPLDDKKTYELYQKGETNGTFQFESAGMQKHLKNLKPTNIEDLIAMNALFRPGPMQFIDTFIARKHGREEVEYPHPKLEEILKDTYGIMVYQEQIMQTAQILGGYSLGQADLLRRAMGKKKKEVMEQQKEVFRKGCEEVHQIPAEQADEIFDVMAKFAEYGFNRSHSAAYSVVAFQTAYLKANYPAEYMSAVLTNNMNDLKKVTFFMEECRRFGVKVLGPDLNESSYNFTVNKEGQIRFGLGAIKGVGEGAVEAVVNERKEAGDYKSVFDLTKRVDLRSVNKRALENMALGGALDSFGKHRAQYFQEENNMTQIEKALRFGSSYQTQQNSSQASLFGESIEEEILEPQIPETEAWGNLEVLSKEKEVVGIFISGNPLDDYRLEIKSFCTPNFNLGRLKNLAEHVGREFRFAGVVSDAQHRTSKNGKPYGVLILEDYDDSYEFRMFGEEYLKFKNYLTANYFLYCTGKVEFNEWRQDTRFVFTNIELLNELMDKRTKALEIGLNLHNINEGLICDMKEVLEREKGSCKVKFIVRADEKMYSELKTKEISVRPTAQLIEDIKALNVDEVKLKS